MASPSIGGDASLSLELASAPRKKRNDVERPGTRAVVPRTLWPNFRDTGGSVDYALLRILENLQRRWGWSHVTEAGLRQMVCEDTGKMPGVGTLPAALERLSAQGLLYQEWLIKGGVLPNGEVATAGVRLVRVAASRSERRAFLGRRPKPARGRRKLRAPRRVMTTGLRVNHRAVFLLEGAAAKPAPAPSAPAVDFERMRGRALEWLAAHRAELEAPS